MAITNLFGQAYDSTMVTVVVGGMFELDGLDSAANGAAKYTFEKKSSLGKRGPTHRSRGRFEPEPLSISIKLDSAIRLGNHMVSLVGPRQMITDIEQTISFTADPKNGSPVWSWIFERARLTTPISGIDSQASDNAPMVMAIEFDYLNGAAGALGSEIPFWVA